MLHNVCLCRNVRPFRLYRRSFKAFFAFIFLILVFYTCFLNNLRELCLTIYYKQKVKLNVSQVMIQSFEPSTTKIYEERRQTFSSSLTTSENDVTIASNELLQRRLPSAIIIGVKKCGTRAVLEFLRLHPDVRAVGPEIHFFDRFYYRGLQWYRNQMPYSLQSQITIEKTPSYFFTPAVPHRIANMSSDVKLILVVRNPVTRAISDYVQTASKRKDYISFDKLVFANGTDNIDTSLSAIKLGIYCNYLKLWLRHFPLRQIHIVDGESLITNTAPEMSKVEAFLELQPIISEKHFYFNQTKGFPCIKKSEGNPNPHCLGKTKGRRHPEIHPNTETRLKKLYEPFNNEFFQLIGKNFSWS